MNVPTPCDSSISWFHQKISREDAESLLINDDKLEGTFLVRESSSALGDYVLSLVTNDDCVHYQIRRHGEDAFFSIDEGPIIHGLEVLIAHYQESANGLATRLSQMCLGKSPPPDSRRHGRTNLLHRATKEGNVTVVSELLKSGYHSLDAKNQDGQTALHLASIIGHDDILTKLLDSGASVNTRDSAGLTPLHYSCQNNRPTTARILLVIGGANIQARSSTNGWVPLHEAASRGFSDVIQILLSQNAPCNPRSNNNETPKDLAQANEHEESVKILENYACPNSRANMNDWFHENIDRNEAVKIIKSIAQNEDGAFLIRRSMRKSNVFVLTMMHNAQPYNFEIQNQDQYYYIDDGPYMESLEHIVDHYSAIADGLPTHLSRPIKSAVKSPKISLSFINPMCTNVNEIENGQNNNNNKTESETPISNRKASNKVQLIEQSSIRLGATIGEGEFGSVLKGSLKISGEEWIDVAVKTLREENIQNGRDAFIREANVMMGLDHKCVVKLLGVSPGPPLMMIQELVAMGSLLDYLLDFPSKINIQEDFLLWATQISCGMMYLESKHFVHRDLAARNILLASKNQVKISDFGLSRAIGVGNEYYKASTGGKWPVKWYAPESINYGTFSHASDVWSYGITLWEMYSFGDQPYGEKTGAEVLDWIENQGRRLSQPNICPDKVYHTMIQCWSYNPEERPTFHELNEDFSHPSILPHDKDVQRDGICLSDPIYV